MVQYGQFGRNYYGEVGNTTVTASSTAYTYKSVQVMNIAEVGGYLGENVPIVDIAAGYFISGAIDATGQLYLWGKGLTGVMGQTGTVVSTNRLPLKVRDTDGTGYLTNIKKVSLFTFSTTTAYAIALSRDGKVYTWGTNTNGCLGVGNTTQYNLPQQPVDTANNIMFSNAIDVSNPNEHSTASYSSAVLTADGNVYTFGLNTSGQLGLGDVTQRNNPTEVIPGYLEEVNKQANLKVGSTYNLNLQWNYGFNVYDKAQPALSYTFESSNTDVATVSNSGVVTGKKVGTASIKVTESNTGSIIYVPVYVRPNTANSIAYPTISVGENFTVALKADGSVWAWGLNSTGQLGDGTTTDNMVPKQVLGENGVGTLNNIVKIAADRQAVLALDKDGYVWSWGYNGYGGLGQGNTTNSLTPVKVKGGETGNEYLQNIIDISADRHSSLALDKNGTVWSWGYNDYGQLGDNTATNRTTPIKMWGNISNVTKVVSGNASSVVLTAEGTVYGTGHDTYGQLGYGASVEKRYFPVQMNDVGGTGKISEVIDLDTDTNLTALLKFDGTMYTCGWNYSGGIGDNGTSGTSTTSATVRRYNPVQVKDSTGTGYLENISSIEAGRYNTFAITKDGTAYGWGLNDNYQLALSATGNKALPNIMQKTLNGGNFVQALQVAAGKAGYHTAILDNEGNIWVTGQNTYGKLGDETTVTRTELNQIQPRFLELNLERNTNLKVNEEKNITAVINNRINLFSDISSAGQLGFISSDENVVTVNATGKMTAKNIGEAYIYAKDINNNLSSVAHIKVTNNNSSSIAVPQVEGGVTHTVALKEDGTVWSWGNNTNGQLGNGTNTNSSKPVQVKDITGIGHLQNIVKISAGNDFTVALDKDGNIYTWGLNTNGRLGDGTTASKNLPVKVNISDVVDISAKSAHVLALKKDGSVWSWGLNTNGRLGDNTTTQRTSPVKVIGDMTNVVKISAGEAHSLALKSDGSVWAWGLNSSYQLGQGVTGDKAYPVPVMKVANIEILTNVVDIEAGNNHSFAITQDNKIYGWGLNTNGQLGDATVVNKSLATLVKGVNGEDYLSDIAKIKAGGAFTIALTKNNQILTWGLNTNGQLGNNTVVQSNYPIETYNRLGEAPFNNIFTIGIGNTYSFAVNNNGEVYSWGYNYNGQLGNGIEGTNTDKLLPVIVASYLEATPKELIIKLGDVEDLSLSYSSYFNVLSNKPVPTINAKIISSNSNIASITADNKVKAENLGSTTLLVEDLNSGLTTTVNVIVKTDTGDKILPKVSNGENFTVVLKEDGTVWTWGSNANGQLGNGTTTDSYQPVQVVDSSGTGYLENIIDIAAGRYYATALDKYGNVYAWGINTNGQLGQANTTQSTTPVQVKTGAQNSNSGYLEDIVQIASGHAHCYALSSSGIVYSWGYNTEGNLGDNSATQKTTPVQVQNLYNIKKISAAVSHGMAIREDGTVWTWGYNGYGGLGDSSTTNRTTPVQVKGVGNSGYLSNIVDIIGGHHHSLALDKDGNVYSWGYNNNGQLGDGTTTNRTTPVQVKGLGNTGTLSNIASVAGGMYYSLAVTNDGEIYGWGLNTSGQLGDNTAINKSYPVQTRTGVSADVFTDVLSVHSGNYAYHSVAIKKDGTVWAFGQGTSYKLADELTMVNKLVATQVCPEYIKVINTSIKKGETDTLNATLVQEFNVFAKTKTPGTLSWKSKDNNIVAIDNNGNITGVDIGQTDIYVKDTVNNISAIFRVTVTNNGTSSVAVPMISAGATHTVSVKEDGSVWVWGDNTNGQLGNGTNTSSGKPVPVKDVAGTGYLENIIKVAAGNDFSVALDKDGNVYTWGLNTNGRLGDGTTVSKNLPVQVNISDIVDISARSGHVLALDKDGNIYGWGYNGYGQLGDNTTTQKTVPTKVLGIANVVKISAGENHSVALKSDGTVFAWGLNTSYQLGQGTTGNKSYPVQVLKAVGEEYLTNVIDIAVGSNHNFAIMENGEVFGWGLNTNGQLGDNTTANKTLPTQVVGIDNIDYLTDIAKIKAGTAYTVALTKDGKILSWGLNDKGQLGNGTVVQSSYPVNIDSEYFVNGIYDIGTGNDFTFAIVNKGELYSWGNNVNSQLGNSLRNITYETIPGLAGSNITTHQKQIILGIGDIEDINVSYDIYFNVFNGKVTPSLDTEIISYNESIVGVNNKKIEAKEVGTTSILVTDKNTGLQTTLQVVVATFANEDAAGIASVITGIEHTLILKEDGTLWAMGDNTYGQLGDGTNTKSSNLVRVLGENSEGYLENIVQIAGNWNTSYALTRDGSVYAWGNGANGRLGVGSTTHSNVPVKVKGLGGNGYLSDIKYIAAGSAHGLAIDNDGRLWAWGYNGYGNLGDSTTTERTTPILSKVYNIKQVSAGEHHTIAVREDGTVLSFGRQYYGKLGNGATADGTVSTPIQVKVNANEYLTNIDSVSCGDYHNIALDKDGNVWGWGYNDDGRVGDGTSGSKIYKPYAVQVKGLNNEGYLSDIYKIATGRASSYVITKANELYTWGLNTSGQLGDNTATNKPYPVIPKYARDLTDFSDEILTISTGNYNYHAIVALKDGTIWGTGQRTNYKLGDVIVATNLTAFTQINPASMQNDEAQITVAQNDTKQLNITYTNELNILMNKEKTIETLEYSSLDENVATVNNGTVTGKNQGRTQIKVTDTDKDLTIYIPVTVTGNKDGVIAYPQVANTNYSTTALKADGSVWTWGLNTNGQLGNDTTTNSNIPIQVKSEDGEGYLENIVQISAGNSHVLALDKDGNVYAWGNNQYGRIGNGITTATNTTKPYKITELSDIVQISAGNEFSMALDKYGRVFTWGRNNYGQLGDNTTTNNGKPVLVQGLYNIAQISAGQENSIALVNNGIVYSWGRNNVGQLSDGTTADKLQPVVVCKASGVYLENIVKISAGNYFNVFKESNNTIWGAGQNSNGQFGDGGTTNKTTGAVEIFTEVEDIKDIVATNANIYILKQDGTLYGAGYNTDGRLGDGTTTAPVKVLTEIKNESGTGIITDVMDIADTIYSAHNTFIKKDGTVWSAGTNTYGELGNECTANTNLVVQAFSAKVKVRVSGYNITLQKGNTEEISAIGYGEFNVYGSTDNNPLTYEIVDTNIATIDSNNIITGEKAGYTNLIVTDTVTSAYAQVNIEVIDTGRVANPQVVSYGNTTVALKADGTVWTWGDNTYGQIGGGSADNTITPTRVNGLDNIIQIVAGEYHVLALRNDGTVYSWGYNANGRLGNNSTTNSATPVKVLVNASTVLTDVVKIACRNKPLSCIKSRWNSLELGLKFKWTIRRWYNNTKNSSNTSIKRKRNRNLFNRYYRYICWRRAFYCIKK